MVRTLGHGLADPAESDDAQRLSRHSGTEHVGGPPAGPAAIAQFTLSLGYTAGDGEQEEQRAVGGVFGQHARGSRLRDALLSRRAKVDRIVSNSHMPPPLHTAST